MTNLSNGNVVNVSNVQDNDDSVVYYGINGYGITWMYLFTHLVLLFIGCVGILLNCLVFYVVRRKINNTDVSHVFIYNLALGDAVNSVLCIYIVLYNLIHFKNYYECAVRCAMSSCMTLNSSVHLLSLTFDRYFKIKFPFAYVRIFQERRMQLFSRSVWVICVLLGLLPILGWRQAQSLQGVRYCSYFGVLTNGYLRLLSVIFYSTYLLLVFCYVSMVWISWRQRKKISCQPAASADVTSGSAKVLWWRPTKTVLLLVSLYAFCWIPSATWVSLHLVGSLSHLSNDQKGTIFAYLGSPIFLIIVGNPVIYAIKSEQVNEKIKALLSRKKEELLFCLAMKMPKWIRSSNTDRAGRTHRIVATGPIVTVGQEAIAGV